MVEELKRANEENRKLTEMLAVACKNYDALQAYLMECLNPSRKRRLSPKTGGKTAHHTKNNDKSNAVTSTGVTETCTTGGLDSKSKKPYQEEEQEGDGKGAIRVKMISRVCVRTEASDSSLVSNCFHSNLLSSTYSDA